MISRYPFRILAPLIVLASCLGTALAQQVTGTLGAPGATSTISGKQLPPPDPAFGGVIREKATESKAWWAPRVVPPRKAPNVLLIMTDDSGFGAPGTFGGVVPTPALDRIAKGRGQSLAQLALAWALRDPRMTSLVIGASSVRQLDDNIAALANTSLTDAELAEIDHYATEADINLWKGSSSQ